VEVHEREQIPRCHLVAPVAPIEHRIYRECSFQALTISVRPRETPVEQRPALLDVRLERCRASPGKVTLLGVVLQDVVVDGFGGAISAQHCAFRRVVFAGELTSDVILRSDMGPIDPEYWAAFLPDNARRHDGVEFSIDVSRASFRNVMLRDVPPTSIRVDPATQAVITRETMRGGEGAFDEAELVGTVGSQIRRAVAGEVLDNLVVVPLGSPVAEQEAALVARLHELGLALPVR
jgi:hypothetical protein